MTDERAMVANAVLCGQLPANLLTDRELVEIQEKLMDRILESKSHNSPMVFWGVKDPSVH